jgi:hypothetical protein
VMRLTTEPDHNAGGQRPTRADRGQAASQASDGNRQRACTLQAEGQGFKSPKLHLANHALSSFFDRPRAVCVPDFRERHDATASTGLRRSEGVAAATQVDNLAGYPYGACVKVDVFRSESREFGPAEAGEGGQQEKRPVSRADGIS